MKEVLSSESVVWYSPEVDRISDTGRPVQAGEWAFTLFLSHDKGWKNTQPRESSRELHDGKHDRSGDDFERGLLPPAAHRQLEQNVERALFE